MALNMEMKAHLPPDEERKRRATHASATFQFENRRRLGRLADSVKKTYWQWILLTSLGFCFGIAHATAGSAEQNCAQWRGPLANGVAPQANPPVTWSETNNIRWKVKIPGDGNATPVGANGRIYLVGRNGTTIVLKRADKLETLATNRLDEKFDALPAVAGKDLFLRGHEHLYCITEK